MALQVAVCCSQEQLHTSEFIRTVDAPVVIDCDEDQSPPRQQLPSVGQFD